MFCKKCGYEIGEDDKFCSACGYSLVENEEISSFSKEIKSVENKSDKKRGKKAVRVIAYILGIYGFLMVVGNWINSSEPYNSVAGEHVVRMFFGIILMILSTIVIIKTKDKHGDKQGSYSNDYGTEKSSKKKGRKIVIILLVLLLAIIFIKSRIMSNGFVGFLFSELPNEESEQIEVQYNLLSYIGLTEDELIDLFGSNYETGYYYGGEYWRFEHVPMLFWFDENKNVFFIESFYGDIKGAQIGMSFSEIKSVLGKPESTGFDEERSYYIAYKIEDCRVIFFSNTEEGPTESVFIKRSYEE